MRFGTISGMVMSAVLLPAAAIQPPSVGVVLKLQQESSKGSIGQIRSAVNDIFRPTGVRLAWRVLGAEPQPMQFDRVVVVELRGRCTPWRIDQVEADHRTRALGWTQVSDGEVTPFLVVDCDQIARALKGSPGLLAGPAGRYNMFWQLAGRVVAHELMHALLRTTEHFGSDCTRSPLRGLDLQSTARLQPAEVAALRRLGTSPDVALARGPVTDKRPAAGQ